MIPLTGNKSVWKRCLGQSTKILVLLFFLSLFLPAFPQKTQIKKLHENTEKNLNEILPLNHLKSQKKQPQDPISKNFRIEDGLISNEAHFVLSDSRGFIWIATDGGICRYDGTKFVRFSISEGLPERMVTKLYEDKKGRIWFITISSHVGYIKDDQVTLLKYKFKKGPNVFKMDDFAHSMYVDEGDTLWVATMLSGMLYKSAYPYTSPPVSKEMKSDFVIEFNKQGDYIYGTSYVSCTHHKITNCTVEVCLAYIEKWKGKTRYFRSNYEAYAGYRSHKIIRVSPEEFLITTKSELLCFRKGKLKVLLKTSVVNSYLDKKGQLWVFTANEGLYLFPDYHKLDKWKHYYQDQYFTAMTQDIEGGTWLTTLYNGVKYIPDFDFMTLLKEGKQLEHIVVNNGKVMVNEKLGDLLIFDKNDFLKRLDMQLFYYSPEIEKDYILCYTANQTGISRMQYVSENKSGVLKKQDYNSTMHIKKIMRYKGNDYLINMSRIHMYDNSRKKNVRLLMTESRINNVVIVNDTIWMATNNGLFSFDLKTRKWVDNSFLRKNLNYRIDDLAESKDGLWLCSFGKGIWYYNKKDKLTLYDEKKGLASNYVRSLYLGPQNNLWVSTNEGLSRITGESDWKIVNYPYLEGYGIGQINDILRVNNDLYLATSNGFYKFPISKLDKQNKTAPIYITAASSRLIKRLQNNAELEYGDDKIVISFLALNYTNARKAEYYYMIKGYDDVWHKSPSSSVRLTKLPPGKYSFIVKTDSNSHATFTFSIKYPFWQKWWFISLTGLLLVICIYTLVNYRTRKIKAEEREKNYIQVQIAGLQANVIRAQMNPHFMFNALNSIQSFILANENKQANFYLGKFSSLMRKIIQISRHDFVTVKEELRLLQDYIEIERMRCAYSFNYEINIGNKESLGVRIPAMIIQPFIENAVNHGLTPLEGREGKLEINFDIYGKNIICTITDNGIGRTKANEIKQKKIRYHQSASIKLTENRIDLYNKLYKAESKISIVDLYDEDGAATGTKVELIIPIIQ
ncbi:MAG: ypdA 2 [Crocinitomicaceae bacterium]|jgi:ligand-binding sensor domain-containing protein|nr:ypdA 2 [Crocinitomicaceae bacterium]